MIPVRYRASLSYLLRHPWQLLLAIVGIGIGVAVIVAVDLANASAREAFKLSMDKVTGQATHQLVGGPRGIDESVYTQLRVEHGIRALAPVVAGTVEIDEVALDILGVDLFAEQEIRTFTGDATVAGEAGGDPQEDLFRAFLTEPGAVAMSSRTAASLGLEPGDEFLLSANGIEQSARLLGVYDSDQAGLDNVLIADLATAQAWRAKVAHMAQPRIAR